MKKAYHSVNMMEQAIDLKLVELMEKSGMCVCEQCCADVRTIALNALPPKYVLNPVGEAMTQFELMTTQMQAVVATEIVTAIERVKRNPHH